MQREASKEKEHHVLCETFRVPHHTTENMFWSSLLQEKQKLNLITFAPMCPENFNKKTSLEYHCLCNICSMPSWHTVVRFTLQSYFTISTGTSSCMLLIRPCHHLCVSMATFCSHTIHAALYALTLSAGRSCNLIVQPQQPRMNLGEDLLQDHQPLRTTVLHFSLLPRGLDIFVRAHARMPTSCDWTYSTSKHACIHTYARPLVDI